MESFDNYTDFTLYKTDVESALGVELTDEEFEDIIFESKDTLISEIMDALHLMYDDLKHIWIDDPNQLEMELS